MFAGKVNDIANVRRLVLIGKVVKHTIKADFLPCSVFSTVFESVQVSWLGKFLAIVAALNDPVSVQARLNFLSRCLERH